MILRYMINEASVRSLYTCLVLHLCSLYWITKRVYPFFCCRIDAEHELAKIGVKDLLTKRWIIALSFCCRADRLVRVVSGLDPGAGAIVFPDLTVDRVFMTPSRLDREIDRATPRSGVDLAHRISQFSARCPLCYPFHVKADQRDLLLTL